MCETNSLLVIKENADTSQRGAGLGLRGAVPRGAAIAKWIVMTQTKEGKMIYCGLIVIILECVRVIVCCCR